ncbi:MMPL family transporter [bacterium AH-315-F18]|nr:MMPL family transporter [bacterium AH-315-F18]
MTSPDQPSKVEAYTRFIARYRFWVLALLAAITVTAATGAGQLAFSNDYRYFFSSDNPQLRDFEALQKVYTKNDNILFALDANGADDVFNTETLAAVEDLTRAAWQIPFALRVDSITNYQHSHAEGEDDLVVEDLVEDARTKSAEERAAARQAALAEPLLVGRILPEDAQVTGVNVTLELPGKDMNETTLAVQRARAIAKEIEAKYPGTTIRLTGMAMLSNAFAESAQNDMATLIPLMYGAILIVIALLLRSLSGTVATLAVVAMASAVAMGVMGWLGLPITAPSSTAPTMIMTLAIADSVHILVAFLAAFRRGLDKVSALVESLQLNMQPVFLTSLTTAVGFLSLNFSDAQPFRDLGNITAVGVVAAFVFSVAFLPALMMVLPVRAPKKAAPKHGLFDRLADAVILHRGKLLVATSLTVLGLAAALPLNDLNDEFVKYFDKRVAFRNDTDFVNDHLTGVYQVEYSLGAGAPGAISEPTYLAHLDAFAGYWRAQDGVVNVSTFSDIMKKLNRNMHQDQAAFYALPNSRELAAQYLLLYEMSLPFGLDLNNQIDVDKSATRFVVTFRELSSKDLLIRTQLGEAWLKDHTPTSMHALGVGTSVMFAYLSGRNVRSMLWGTLIALLLISVVLAVALRSVSFGLLSLIPNLVPAVMAFGLWGLVDGQIGIALSVVTAMTLGIVVDDTVHFLSKYLRARRELGLDAEDAVRYTFRTVGMAMTVTSAVLFIGFMILSLSPFALNGDMGRLTAITIVLALVADFLLLPPLLLAWHGKKKVAGAPTPTPSPLHVGPAHA